LVTVNGTSVSRPGTSVASGISTGSTRTGASARPYFRTSRTHSNASGFGRRSSISGS
jgi:hypothetical protein